MARGGKREGAGRKPDPNSRRQRALAKRATKEVGEQPIDRGLTLPSGEKSPDAPENWPFGKQPAQAPVPQREPEPAKRQTAREFLSDQVNDLELDVKLRLDAAKKLIEYEEAKPAPMGKKEAKVEQAKKVAGKFASAEPPRLAAAHGKRL